MARGKHRRTRRLLLARRRDQELADARLIARSVAETAEVTRH